MNDPIKPIAFYLPQFHPIPENDEWWGKGFTEWTNVAKARPLFEGHWQPRLPGDLGFYDLRVGETREAQAVLAKQYGIYGFCYYHYWFGGKQILERPLQEVIAAGKPDIPFCIAWANQTWKGTWHGLSNDKVLVEQTYPGKEDHKAHFYSLLPAFKDPRYIEVNGKKMFLVFQPQEIPNSKDFIAYWQELAQQEGLKGIHFVAMHMPSDWDPAQFGYDTIIQRMNPWEKYIETKILKRDIASRVRRKLFPPKPAPPEPRKVFYEKYVSNYPETEISEKEFPLISADWDNTPRSGADGWLFKDFSFDLFGQLCEKAFKETKNKPEGEKFVFVKSWNEWAEGNYLEPDQKHGYAYLNTFKKAMDHFYRSLK